MKAAIIGAGNVGKAILHDLQLVDRISEITLVGRNKRVVEAEVLDARDAAVLRETYGPRLYFGGYEATEGADIIIYAAGTSKFKTHRMELLHDNCAIAEEVFREINRYNRDAVIINVTNPLDVVTMRIQQVTGRDPHKVIGSGTLLESARLVRVVAELLEISDRSIHMSVVGEHGPTAVALMSSVRVMGLTLEEYMKATVGETVKVNMERLNEAFKNEAFRIFYGKGYTSTGVAATACRIAAAIAADSREVFPVSSVLQGEYGVQGIAVSVPSVLGRNGIHQITEWSMTEEEHSAFLASVDTVRQAAETVGIL